MSSAPSNEWGTASRRTTAEVTVIASGVNAALIGILFSGTATGSVQLFAGTTATATAAGVILTGIIRSCVSATALANFVRVPAYCSGGMIVDIGGTSPDVTLFWNPVGS